MSTEPEVIDGEAVELVPAVIPTTTLFGTDNPNDVGLLPADSAVVSYYEQQTPDGYFFQQFKWNPTHQFWG